MRQALRFQTRPQGYKTAAIVKLILKYHRDGNFNNLHPKIKLDISI